jgi:proton-dependent oligopeptide transporter, POT family
MNSFQPKGYYPLFTIFALERMCYYGVRALLVLFMTKFLLLDVAKAGNLYGWFLGITMATPILGGLIIDKWLGQRKAVFVSIIAIIIGCGLLAAASTVAPEVPSPTGIPTLLYAALAMIAVSGMLYKPAMYVTLANLYDDENDPRRDSGFLLTFIAVNIGAFFAPFICGELGEKIGWLYGFASAGAFALIALCIIKYVPSAIKNRSFSVNSKSILFVILLFFFAILFPFKIGNSALEYAQNIAPNEPMIFNWMSVAYTIPRAWMSTAYFLPDLLFCVILAWLWVKLAKINKNPATIYKFIIGLVLLLIGVATLGSLSSGDIKLSNIVSASIFIGTGELFISPIFMSLLTKIAPKKWASTFIGGYYTLMGGTFVASYIANAYYPYGLKLFLITIGAALVVVVLLRNRFTRWLNGIN